MATTTKADANKETRELLLKNVKKEVKQLMEEAVTRKFVHEESGGITTLCATVELCLQHGLKKRALGLFKNSTTNALLHKVSKTFEPAAQIVKMMHEVEVNNENARKSIDSNKNQTPKKPTYNPKYLWTRLALFEKQLAKIIDYLVNNNLKYYEKDALIADPVDGPILASLLVGPCALDYTKMKTADHFWTDPPADELVQRHRIHSGQHHIRSDSPKRPGLNVRRHTSSSSEENTRSSPLSAKEYVESLHQNSKSTLLYGKNNVIVQPKEDVTPLAGYLSLHQGSDGLSVKWTPNQLMNGCCEEEAASIDRRPIYGKRLRAKNGYRTFLYWDYAVTIYMEEVVYLHCHQQPDSGGTIVMVGQDGVQRPPIHFPKGGHLLAFLSCLENGLLPHGQLDPPLWSQRGKGKVFPKLKRKASQLNTPNLSHSSQGSSCGSVDETALPGIGEEDEATDYVFRLINRFRPENMPAELFDPKAKDAKSSSTGGTSTVFNGPSSFPWPPREPRIALPISNGSSSSSSSSSSAPAGITPSAIQTYAKTQEQQNSTCISRAGHRWGKDNQITSAVKQLCDTMTHQILSRAFYGWLSYCRHLKTVRTHLSGLVNSTVISVEDPVDGSNGLTVEVWQELCKDGVVTDSTEVNRLVYYGGCQETIRNEVWPYLLGHYKFGCTPEERRERDEGLKQQYEKTMSEWLAIEAIVRQRDKEIMAANLAKLSQESQDGHIPLVRKDSSLSNDVFESVDSDDFSHPETVPEESSSALLTPTSPAPASILSESAAPRISQTSEPPGEDETEQQEQQEDAEQEHGGGDNKHRHMLIGKRSTDSKDFSTTSPDEGIGDSIGASIGAHPSSTSDSKRSDSCDTDKNVDVLRSESDDPAEQLLQQHQLRNIIITTNPTVDLADVEEPGISEVEEAMDAPQGSSLLEQNKLLQSSEDGEHLSASRESLIASPVSNASNGGVYTAELLDNVALNLHRIDKDVQRCDRNYSYFNTDNLDKLRNVMCTYVWEHLEVGYVQGMCDLVAPLLVIFDEEAKTYSCFCQLMKRMSTNFPHGGAMDQHFANMRSLIQILDHELFEHMHQNGDYTHFYFCYRWFLLDFKRELVYEDVFSVWESIWAAKHISSPHFVLFIALALVEYYRGIIMDNHMDFTDIIKFFNEMAERHQAKQVLNIARDLVFKLQALIDNK